MSAGGWQELLPGFMLNCSWPGLSDHLAEKEAASRWAGGKHCLVKTLTVEEAELQIRPVPNAQKTQETSVKPKPKGSRRSDPSASGCQHRCPSYLCVVLVLGFLVLILLGVIAILSKPLLKGRAGKPESVSQYGLNRTGNLMSSEKTDLDKLLKWIKEELCNSGWGEERKICELCPPGWQLHSGRCYYFSEASLSWLESEKYCLDSSSQLLVFENASEMDFIDKKDKDNRYIWFGRIEDIKKQWISAEDPGLNEMRTAINRIETDRNCPVYRRKYTLQGDNCQTLKKWICKKNASVFIL